MHSKLVTLIITTYTAFSFANVGPTVKLYNWWDYLAPKVANQIKKSGYLLDMTSYTSNNQAISRLYTNSDNYDFVIISKLTMETLQKYNLFDPSLLKRIRSKRNYNKLTNGNDICLPYLWGPTVFVSNQKLEQVTTEKLENLVLKDSFIFDIIDDPSEFYSMFIAMNECERSDVKCFRKKYSQINNFITPKNFKSEVFEKDITKKYIFYGWLGATKKVMFDNHIDLKVYIPPKVVIGQDYLCLMRSSKLSEKDKINFASLLTNYNNSKINQDFSGYFSPYPQSNSKKTEKGFNRYKTIFEDKIQRKEYILLPTTKDKVFSDLHQLWSKIRYE